MCLSSVCFMCLSSVCFMCLSSVCFTIWRDFGNACLCVFPSRDFAYVCLNVFLVCVLSYHVPDTNTKRHILERHLQITSNVCLRFLLVCFLLYDMTLRMCAYVSFECVSFVTTWLWECVPMCLWCERLCSVRLTTWRDWSDACLCVTHVFVLRLVPTHRHTHTHAHTHTHTHTHTQAGLSAFTRNIADLPIHTHTYKHTHTHVPIRQISRTVLSPYHHIPT